MNLSLKLTANTQRSRCILVTPPLSHKPQHHHPVALTTGVSGGFFCPDPLLDFPTPVQKTPRSSAGSQYDLKANLHPFFKFIFFTSSCHPPRDACRVTSSAHKPQAASRLLLARRAARTTEKRTPLSFPCAQPYHFVCLTFLSREPQHRRDGKYLSVGNVHGCG